LGRFSANWFVDYLLYVSVPVSLLVGVVTTIWFVFGVTKDIRTLLLSLKSVHSNDADDGTVRNHHNLGEGNLRGPAVVQTVEPAGKP